MTKRTLTTQHETYISMMEAERLSGRTRNAIRRAAIRHGIPFYKDPMDARRTLMAVTDVERLFTPQATTA